LLLQGVGGVGFHGDVRFLSGGKYGVFLPPPGDKACPVRVLRPRSEEHTLAEDLEQQNHQDDAEHGEENHITAHASGGPGVTSGTAVDLVGAFALSRSAT